MLRHSKPTAGSPHQVNLADNTENTYYKALQTHFYTQRLEKAYNLEEPLKWPSQTSRHRDHMLKRRSEWGCRKHIHTKVHTNVSGK